MNRHALLKSAVIIILVAVIALAVVLARGRQTQESEAALLYNVGTLQPDGTILYSLLYYSGDRARSNLTFTGAVPAEATLVEPVIAPAGAQFSAVTAGSATWALERVDAYTILGPFTFRLQFNTPANKPPLTLPAQASWTAPAVGSVESAAAEGTLQPLADSGTLVLDPAGTLNAEGEPWPVEIGGTGIWFYAPEGAVAEPVELTFTRLAVDATNIPQDVTNAWWCAMVAIESSLPVTLARPVLLGLPTRQVLTIGIPVQVLGRGSSDETWQSLPAAEGLRIGGGGNLAAVILADTLPAILVAGVDNNDRQNGTVSTGGEASTGPAGDGSNRQDSPPPPEEGGEEAGGSGSSGGSGGNVGFQGSFGGSNSFQSSSFGSFQGFNTFGGGFQGGFGGFNSFQSGSFGGGFNTFGSSFGGTS
jgi:hypothetical protein